MSHYRILLAGDTGTGKTTQLETMPRPWYVHVFDPAAHTAVSLLENEFTDFFPAQGDLDLALQGERKLSPKGPQVYNRWAETFNRELEAGRFNGLGTFMLDSATMLGMHLMERQRWLGDKSGRKDERIDHRFAGNTMTSALWSVFSLPCHVLVTMHTKYVEERVGETKTGAMKNRLTVPGDSQLTLPRFTSACWYTSVVEDRATKKPRFMALTRPQRAWPHVRTPRTWGELELYHDLTIEDWSRPQDFGIGALLR